jgi:hypothetical protein
MRFIKMLACTPMALVLFSASQHGAVSHGISERDNLIRAIDQAEGFREQHLAGYSVTEHYSVHNARFQTAAQMTVKTTYTVGAGKSYEVVSRSGSEMLQKRVLDRLLEAEKEMSEGQARDKALLISANYDIKLAGEENFNGRRCIIVHLDPKSKSRNVLKGRAWLDAKDYSLVRIEGRPTASASFWAGKPLIVRDYENMRGFSVATRSHAISDSLLLGRTELMIDYVSYQIRSKEDHAKQIK